MNHSRIIALSFANSDSQLVSTAKSSGMFCRVDW